VENEENNTITTEEAVAYEKGVGGHSKNVVIYNDNLDCANKMIN
jgi:hypothetical protein